jgi:membrane-associated protease RseP (regulator of RpoE activity)
MSEGSNEAAQAPFLQQSDFERITQIVNAEFQVEEALMELGVPTYYLKQPQETKEAFLRLLKNLETMNLIAILRRRGRRIVLKVVPKPQVKPSNTRINWILLLATIATTFITGYIMLPPQVEINPLISGATFTIAILAILGTHEMGHKLTANKKKMEATMPYFIPGPPPLGTLGAVIMQKSLPPNRDALFDIGANGPISGFIIATIVSIIGLTQLIPSPPLEGATTIKMPILWYLLAQLMSNLNLIPQVKPPNEILLLHPITYAGWAGLVVTMINMLPTAMLDGGHVARSIAGEKTRYALRILSIVFLFVAGTEFWFMAFLVLFMSMAKHPGPLDDVSSLSKSRKLLTIALVAIFISCSFLPF